MRRRNRYARRLPSPWVKLNLDGRPGDVERMARRVLAEVSHDPDHVRFIITVSHIQGPGTLWNNRDFCERHAALGQRLAELDPQDQHRLLARFPPETTAFLQGQPDVAKRLVLGPGADLLDDELFAYDADLDARLRLPDIDLDFGWGVRDPEQDVEPEQDADVERA